MSYWIHPDAETELGDAAVYYAKHAGFAIGEAFLLEFERVLEIIVENQGRGPYGEFGFRVYHFGRFPYSVVYEEHALAGPQVYAVAHQHRERKRPPQPLLKVKPTQVKRAASNFVEAG